MHIKKAPMGWNSWNTFMSEINEKLILESADAMVEKGYRDAGYEYIVIDDCWSMKERDENGRLVPNPEKFPHGMKYVADYIHSKGLKFGMYSCAGILTCAGYPSSYGHEFIDAATFAEWGVDFLKYDFCYFPKNADGKPGVPHNEQRTSHLRTGHSLLGVQLGLRRIVELDGKRRSAYVQKHGRHIQRI